MCNREIRLFSTPPKMPWKVNMEAPLLSSLSPLTQEDDGRLELSGQSKQCPHQLLSLSHLPTTHNAMTPLMSH